MNATAVISIAAALGLAAAGTAVYVYEKGQPISITLAPSTANFNRTTTSLARKSGQQIVLHLPAGGTWVAVSNLSPLTGGTSSSTSTQIQAGGNTPVTYTQNATDIALVAVWTLNGATYINEFKFA